MNCKYIDNGDLVGTLKQLVQNRLAWWAAALFKHCLMFYDSAERLVFLDFGAYKFRPLQSKASNSTRGFAGAVGISVALWEVRGSVIPSGSHTNYTRLILQKK